MKRILLAGFALFISIHGTALAEGVPTTTVSKLKVILDDEEHIVIEGESAVTSEVSTVLSFVSLRPGRRLTVKELAEETRESQERLTGSGYYYEAQVMTIPHSENPAFSTVLIAVQTGYLWRYGGGNAWGMFGKVGLGGERASFRLYAGWNKQGGSYLHEGIGNLPLALGGSLFYFGPGDYPGKGSIKGWNRGEAAATLGWRFHPDVFMGADARFSGIGPTQAGFISIEPFVRIEEYFETGHESTGEANARFFWFPESGTAKAEMSGAARLGLTEKTTIAFFAGAGGTFGRAPEETRFDLYFTEDRSVRAGYDALYLQRSEYALISTEIRRTVFDALLPPAISCKAHVFAFADYAVFAEAVGGGIRILFANPVFASFSFSYGMNRDFNGRFCFAGTAGY